MGEIKKVRCIDCGSEANNRLTGGCVPPFSVVYACDFCSQERINYFEKEGVPKITGKEVELCVLCGVETEYKRDTPVDMRDFYVDGVGQCCSECFH